jgi:hypothetical protein
MEKQHLKLAKYLRGCADTLKLLAKEIEKDGSFTKESEELMGKVGSEMLFHAKSYGFLAPPPRTTE